MQRLRPLYFLLISLLLGGLSACSQKSEPAPTNVASYELDGRLISCKATAALTSDAHFQYLNLTLFTTPEPVTGRERFVMFFFKPLGGPDTAYEAGGIANYYTGASAWSTVVTPTTVTLTVKNGGFSGAFSGSANYPVSTFQNGTFTNVQP